MARAAVIAGRRTGGRGGRGGAKEPPRPPFSVVALLSTQTRDCCCSGGAGCRGRNDDDASNAGRSNPRRIWGGGGDAGRSLRARGRERERPQEELAERELSRFVPHAPASASGSRVFLPPRPAAPTESPSIGAASFHRGARRLRPCALRGLPSSLSLFILSIGKASKNSDGASPGGRASSPPKNPPPPTPPPPPTTGKRAPTSSVSFDLRERPTKNRPPGPRACCSARPLAAGSLSRESEKKNAPPPPPRKKPNNNKRKTHRLQPGRGQRGRRHARLRRVQGAQLCLQRGRRHLVRMIAFPFLPKDARKKRSARLPPPPPPPPPPSQKKTDATKPKPKPKPKPNNQ